MIGTKIGIGVGISFHSKNINQNGGSKPPTYLSCFGNGIWEDEGYWINEDVWKNENTNPPFLNSGIWNNEGVFRFKDTFSFGTSFLPTGFVMFEGIFRYNDKIKVQSVKKTARKQPKIDKSYWNF